MTSHQRKSPGIKKALVTTGTAASLLGASFVAMPATFANVPDQVPTSPACDCQPGQPGQPGQGGQGQTGQPGQPGQPGTPDPSLPDNNNGGGDWNIGGGGYYEGDFNLNGHYQGSWDFGATVPGWGQWDNGGDDCFQGGGNFFQVTPGENNAVTPAPNGHGGLGWVGDNATPNTPGNAGNTPAPNGQGGLGQTGDTPQSVAPDTTGQVGGNTTTETEQATGSESQGAQFGQLSESYTRTSEGEILQEQQRHQDHGGLGLTADNDSDNGRGGLGQTGDNRAPQRQGTVTISNDVDIDLNAGAVSRGSEAVNTNASEDVNGGGAGLVGDNGNGGSAQVNGGGNAAVNQATQADNGSSASSQKSGSLAHTGVSGVLFAAGLGLLSLMTGLVVLLTRRNKA